MLFEKALWEEQYLGRLKSSNFLRDACLYSMRTL